MINFVKDEITLGIIPSPLGSPYQEEGSHGPKPGPCPRSKYGMNCSSTSPKTNAIAWETNVRRIFTLFFAEKRTT